MSRSLPLLPGRCSEMASNIDLFFNTSRNKRTFPEVLAEIQEYLASKYSTLITDNPEEQHQQITAYIAK